jgi:hypothetical protein
MDDDRPTATEIRALLGHVLSGAAGGTEAFWSGLVGEVELLPIAFHPRCNWRVTASGTAGELDTIAQAVEIVIQAHPYARA